jgi:FAD/FMN-containing dehydrogenase
MMTGGFGFLGRAHGLSMDNLVEVELVLADGRIAWIKEAGPDGAARGQVEWPDGKKEEMPLEEAKELWWGLRGAGTALGVATRYRAKAYHVPVVFAGNLI